MTAADVIAGTAHYSIECADALEFLRSLPDDSIDLLVTSPPYLKARTYSRDDVSRGIDEWTTWMVEVVTAAAPKVKGLIAVNCEGQTENYAYQPAPQTLAADLFRAGFNLRRPVIFHRIGIPGSGGPDWVRGDTESIICITRPGKLPWSDNTACGHPPKWAPGGEMSHMLTNGTRINQWGKTGALTGTTVDGDREKPGIGKPRPSHVTTTVNVFNQSGKPKGGRRANGKLRSTETVTPHCAKEKNFRAAKDGTVKGGHKREIPSRKVMTREREGMHSQESTLYMEPVLANPGNVIERIYTAQEVAEILARLCEDGNVLSLNVGGGAMGHPISHMNEAPFPLDLPAFFVKSFCPPHGIVCDPFGGSFTTLHAAFEHGRRFVGCDIRESQCDLGRRRVATVTADMFAGLEPMPVNQEPPRG